jgi:hypothetical protein
MPEVLVKADKSINMPVNPHSSQWMGSTIEVQSHGVPRPMSDAGASCHDTSHRLLFRKDSPRPIITTCIAKTVLCLLRLATQELSSRCSHQHGPRMQASVLRADHAVDLRVASQTRRPKLGAKACSRHHKRVICQAHKPRPLAHLYSSLHGPCIQAEGMATPAKIYFATGNQKKLTEVRALWLCAKPAQPAGAANAGTVLAGRTCGRTQRPQGPPPSRRCRRRRALGWGGCQLPSAAAAAAAAAGSRGSGAGTRGGVGGRERGGGSQPVDRVCPCTGRGVETRFQLGAGGACHVKKMDRKSKSPRQKKWTENQQTI